MIDANRIREARKNLSTYLKEGLIRKEHDKESLIMYVNNSDLSLRTANELMSSNLKPYLWVIVISYYSMFYMANAALLYMGYKTQDKIVHKVTNDALIVLVLDKLKQELLDNYFKMQEDALHLARIRAETIIETYYYELRKRSVFQYNMLEEAKRQRAITSLSRASEFVLEIRQIISPAL